MKLLILILSSLFITTQYVFAVPYINDPGYTVETYVTDLITPVSMAFVGDDILIVEKITGNVRLVKNGTLQNEPVIHVNVNSQNEQGLVGITTTGNFVYLYFTEAESHGGTPIGNMIYKYVWDGKTLTNEKLVHEIPRNALNNTRHLGGAMITNDEGDVYIIIGDGDNKGILQNFKKGEIYDAGIILHANFDESILKPSQSENPQDHYYAIGIRNSYGITIDPVTGKMWDTENGITIYDEINLVETKFNSGWKKIMGPATDKQIQELPEFYNYQYSDPEFSWERTVAPTGLTFTNSDYFRDYHDYLLVGAFNTHKIYKFKLNSERTGFVFDEPLLQDLVLNLDDPQNEIVFGTGFAGPTDLKVGPDGLLYVVSIFDGTVYRIIPENFYTKQQKIDMPDWVKDKSNLWLDKKILDDEFITTIQFFLTDGLIIIPEFPEDIGKFKIPIWIKNNIEWWYEGFISDLEYVNGIQFLVENGILFVNYDQIKCEIKPHPGINLSGCDLSGVDFSELNLSHANFKYANLNNSKLSNSILVYADFTGAHLSNSIIEGANLQESNFHEANLENANLKKADFTEANLNNTNLKNAKLNGAILFATNLQNSNLSHADLTSTNLEKSDLSNANLSYARLINAELFSSFLKNVTLNYANFTNADLRNTTISDAGLHNADLTNADLVSSSLINANFENANLTNADMRRAVITNSNFENADLTNADMTRAVITNSNFENADLTNVDMRRAVTTNSNFENAILEGCESCPSN